MGLVPPKLRWTDANMLSIASKAQKSLHQSRRWNGGSFPIVVNVSVSLISHNIKNTNELLNRNRIQLNFLIIENFRDSVNFRCAGYWSYAGVPSMAPFLLVCQLMSAEAKTNSAHRLLRVLAKGPKSDDSFPAMLRAHRGSEERKIYERKIFTCASGSKFGVQSVHMF